MPRGQTELIRPATHTRGLTALRISTVAVPLAARGGDDDGNDNASSSAGASHSTRTATVAAAPPADTSPREITLRAANFQLDPPVIGVNANQPLTLRLGNKDAPGAGDPIRHSFHLLNVMATNGVEPGSANIPPGTATAIKFTAGRPGSYDFQGDVHPDWMKGTLTVG